MNSEIWKDIKGYENLYQVSNLGRVKSLGRTIKKFNGRVYCDVTYQPKILKNRLSAKGYEQVLLCKDGKNKSISIHRLVAEAFIENPNNYPCINHKSGITTDNNVTNLEWCTHQQNCVHRSSILKKGYIKKVSQYDKKGNYLKTWDSIIEVKRELGINNSNIGECCKGRRKTAGNYIWREVL